MILDGWGWSKNPTGNAILAADTPNINHLRQSYPFFLLQASGLAVGLPPLEEGNSEVGHLTLGSGRIIIQYLTLINESFKNGSFFSNENFKKLCGHIEKNKSNLHIAGLLTSGKVHSSIDHLLSITEYLKTKELSGNVFLHLFTDGKDSGKKESLFLLEKIEKAIQNSKIKIGSIIGRDFAMDRDTNWLRTEQAYELLVFGKGEKVSDFKEAVKNHHSSGTPDDLMPPMASNQSSLIKDEDGILFFNFREDSMRQLVMAFGDQNFDVFETKKFGNLFLATMTNYGNGLKIEPLFKRPEIKNTLGEVLEKSSLKQARIAETAKYAHLTYFFNGLREKEFEGETDLLIPSLKEFEQNPKMRAEEIAEKIIEEMRNQNFEFIVANFANADMLSHTGNFEATTKGVEAVDQAVGKIYQASLISNPVILITGDHGNAETLTYLGTGEKESKHNPNPVPLFIVGQEFKKDKNEEEILYEESRIAGMLQDIAPTILKLMKIEKPPEMTGLDLI